eukprot:TRINITY_DN6607_c0_g1_i3.p1 TRINITY_DN6607_c0_g1~~TRINITY_DN6607_c0_g1_i3.p1  ORF type:complete len:108 (-),score=12.59 TRINITY_DN6607_c0_g1_i3:3-326(-)
MNQHLLAASSLLNSGAIYPSLNESQNSGPKRSIEITNQSISQFRNNCKLRASSKGITKDIAYTLLKDALPKLDTGLLNDLLQDESQKTRLFSEDKMIELYKTYASLC